jgi:hypothetical protein
MFFRVGERGPDAVGFRVHMQGRRELRLPARSTVIDNQYFGDHTSEVGAKIEHDRLAGIECSMQAIEFSS